MQQCNSAVAANTEKSRTAGHSKEGASPFSGGNYISAAKLFYKHKFTSINDTFLCQFAQKSLQLFPNHSRLHIKSYETKPRKVNCRQNVPK